MKKVFSIILASTLTHVAFAESTQANILDNQELKSEHKQDSSVKDIITKAKISGFGFARFFTINGFNNLSGQSQQYRIKLDATTGKIYGFSVTGGIFFSQGSSTPDAGNNTDSAVQGGRGTAFNGNFSDRFNISQIYASKEFNTESISANFDIGKINISSPLSDNKVDLGTGAVFNMKQKLNMGNFKYHISFYDSFSGDHVGYNIRVRKPMSGDELKDQDAASIGIGNNFTLLGVSGEMLDKKLNFKVYAGNIWKLMDFIAYGDASYKIKLNDNISLNLLAQTSMATLSNNARLFLGYKGKSASSEFDTELNTAAKFRGIYNLQAALKISKFSTKIGYLGSFGDGYGVLLDYKGGIDTSGKIWNGNITATYEGLGMLGSGSFKNTSINVAYISCEYGFKIPLKIGIDVAYIFGNTNMPTLKLSGGGQPISTIDSKQNFISNASFVEITPQISYKFVKNLELSIFAATLVGDIDFFKTRSELKYTF